MRNLFILFWRECLLCYRRRTELLNPLCFFILVTVLFPLAISPTPHMLRTLGPGVIWVAALLSTLLSLTRLFKEDYQDGSLEQLLLSSQSFSVSILIKITAHWLFFNLPLVIIAPFFAAMFYLSMPATGVLLICLLIGTPLLILIGAIGSALTVGVKNSSLLLALLIIPLFIPVLIFGTSAVNAAQSNSLWIGQFFILSALLVLTLTLAPLTTAFALRLNIYYHLK